MLVSVIIPSFNHESYILEAIQSVLTQSYQNIELIIIDDGSSDKSLDIIHSIDDPRLNCYEQENTGAHQAINRGLKLAKGDFLSILNSDDVYHPERIQQCVDSIKADDTDFVCSWIEVVDSDSKTLGIKQGWKNMLPSWANPSAASGFWNINNFKLNLLSTNFISTTSNMLFKRELLESVGYMRNLRFCHDWDFALRVASAHSCSIVDSPLLQYRVHGNNTISSNKQWMLFETCWVLAANMHRFSDLGLFEKAASAKQLIEQVEGAQLSLGARDCERLLTMLIIFISSRRETIGEKAAEELLEDKALRDTFIKIIEGNG